MSRGLMFLSRLSPTSLRVGREAKVGVKETSQPKISVNDRSVELLSSGLPVVEDTDEDDSAEISV